MIVPAAERLEYTWHGTHGFPVEANLGQRGAHQRADEDQIAAVFLAQQFCQPAELTYRNPVMTKTPDLDRIANAPQGKKNRTDATRDQRISNCKRQYAASCNEANRRRNLQRLTRHRSPRDSRIKPCCGHPPEGTARGACLRGRRGFPRSRGPHPPAAAPRSDVRQTCRDHETAVDRRNVAPRAARA